MCICSYAWLADAIYICMCRLVQELLRLKHVCEAYKTQHDEPSDRQLVALLRAVSRCVALLRESHHEMLMTEILNIKLWDTSPLVREAVLHFICHAVVANGSCIQSSLHVLVYSMIPPPGPPSPDPCPGEAWNPSEETAAIQNSVIVAMKRVLELVPTAVSRLLPILVSNMPHKMRDRETHCLYLRGLFSIAESHAASGLGDGILSAVIGHLIEIDVDIKWEDIVETINEEAKEEEKGEQLPKDDEPDIFDLEGMSEGEACLGGTEPRGGWEGCGEAEVINPQPVTANKNEEEKKAPVDETADKMDSLMEMTMAHLRHRISHGEIQNVWRSLLQAFESVVLHTHRSKFTQFIMFYVASQSPIHCSRSFTQLLLGKLADRNLASIVRSASASYIGSFLARAAYVPETIVIESFQRLAEWCVRYAKEEDRRGGLPPIPSAAMLGNSNDAITRHASFYAACQALLYALCYHMEPLSTHHVPLGRESPRPYGGHMPGSLDSEGKSVKEKCAESLHKLFIDTIPVLLKHKLDPLSSCARSVVSEFMRQASNLGHTDIADIIMKWERNTSSVGGVKCCRPLEIFFPFDPYLLRRSAEPMELQKNYVKWRKGHPAAVIPDSVGLDSRMIGGSSDDDLISSGLMSEIQSDDDSSLSSSDSDELKRTRFGSMPDSSLSSGGRRFLGRRLPGALKASLVHGGAGGSPTGGVPIMKDSPSTETGSPWGMSPAYYGSFAPMSHNSHEFFPSK